MSVTTVRQIVDAVGQKVFQGYNAITGLFQEINVVDGAACVTQSSLPADFHTQITPTIAGVSYGVVVINGAAPAGSKRIWNAQPVPTLANVLAEQIVWNFSSLDVIRQVEVSLNVTPISVTGLSSASVEAVKAPEVQSLLVTINPGDDVTAATRLTNGYPEVFEVLPGERLVISSSVAITKVYAIAKLSQAASVLQNTATAMCKGASHV